MAILNQYEFKFNGVKIPNWEPIGWDAVKFALKRDKDDNGYEFTFSNNLEVQANSLPGQIVRNAYNEHFVDAYVKLEIDSCFGWHYEGVVNFTIYKELEGRISFGIKESNFSDTFAARYDTPVDLSKEAGVDGLALSPLVPKEITLYSKELIFDTSYKINENLKDQTVFQDYIPVITFTAPFTLLIQEVEESMEPFEFAINLEADNLGGLALFYSGFQYVAGVYSRTIQVSGRIKLDFYSIGEIIGTATGKTEPHDGTLKLELIVRRATEDIVISTTSLFDGYVDTTPGNAVVDISFDESVNFPPDSNMFILFTWVSTLPDYDVGTGSPYPRYTIICSFDEANSFLKYVENSVYPESTTKGYLLYEALNRVAEAITGVTDAIRSDYLGRVDSEPRTYVADGGGSLILVTNGFQIRKFEDRPVVASFKTLFESINASDCLGIRVEGQTIRIEPKEYFYQLESAQSFSYVPSIQENPSLGDIYNEVEIEYQNQGDTKQLNKLDEFNTKRNYTTPIRNHKNKLQIRCEAITSGYALEFTRREQYKASPSKDYPTDNNIFFIAVERAGGSFQPENDDPFEPVTNLISPDTAYNIRFSPARVLKRWEKVFAGCLFRSPSKVVKFVTGTGNYLMIADGLAENSDLATDPEANALYFPIEASFQAPMSFQDFLFIRDNAIKAIEYSCSGTDHKKGFIRQIEFEPNNNGGTATFKLIQANADRD